MDFSDLADLVAAEYAAEIAEDERVRALMQSFYDQAPPAPVSCCADPCVRGGCCVNCGTWVEDVAGLPQGDNEG